LLTVVWPLARLLRRGTDREYLKAWDLQTGELKSSLQGHTGGVWSLAEHCGTLYSGSDDGSIKAWSNTTNATNMTCTKTVPAHEGRVRALHYAEGTLYSGGHDGKVKLTIPTLPPPCPHPAMLTLLLQVYAWDMSTGEKTATFAASGGWITAIISLEGGLLAVASTDKSVTVYDKATLASIATLQHESWVSSLAADATNLYAGVGDGSVTVWNASSRSLLCKLTGHMEHHAVSALALREGILYTTAWDGAVMRWSMAEVETKLANQAAVVAVEVKAVAAVEKEPEEVVQNIFDETDCELLD